MGEGGIEGSGSKVLGLVLLGFAFVFFKDEVLLLGGILLICSKYCVCVCAFAPGGASGPEGGSVLERGRVSCGLAFAFVVKLITPFFYPVPFCKAFY